MIDRQCPAFLFTSPSDISPTPGGSFRVQKFSARLRLATTAMTSHAYFESNKAAGKLSVVDENLKAKLDMMVVFKFVELKRIRLSIERPRWSASADHILHLQDPSMPALTFPSSTPSR